MDFSQNRRNELFSLLGKLPSLSIPVSCRQISEEDCGNYILERLILDVQSGTSANPRGEKIPAYFSKPKNSNFYPAVLFSHSHGGLYEMGKEEMVSPPPYMFRKSYASALAERGIAALCIDHWGFGERSGREEASIFKDMLWHGEVMWGRMVYDSLRAMDYLCSRSDVDANRIAALGMSMGSTMSWWLAALDERVKICVDICCLTDYDALLEEDGLSRHGIYYYVPDLLNHFSSSDINKLIAPRPHLGTVGIYDNLTPIRGVDRIEKEVKLCYADFNAAEHFRILRYPNAHKETAEMRTDILSFIDRYL